jgi:hypothetical protein
VQQLPSAGSLTLPLWHRMLDFDSWQIWEIHEVSAGPHAVLGLAWQEHLTGLTLLGSWGGLRLVIVLPAPPVKISVSLRLGNLTFSCPEFCVLSSRAIGAAAVSAAACFPSGPLNFTFHPQVPWVGPSFQSKRVLLGVGLGLGPAQVIISLPSCRGFGFQPWRNMMVEISF